MKKKLVTLLLAFAFFSCEDFVTGIDEKDPTLPVDANLNLVVTASQLEMAGTLEGELARLAGMWSGAFTGSDRQYINLYNYNSVSADYDNAWNNVFTFTLKQLRIAQKKAKEVGNSRTLGVTQVMEAHLMLTATTLWGNVPYTQAANFEQFPNPQFDNQADIIDDLEVLLIDALANLATGAGNFNGDIWYKTPYTGGGAQAAVADGTVQTRWTRAANTVLARLYLYKKDYTRALAAANLGILTNADNMTMGHGSINGQNRNIYYDFMVRQRPGYMSGAGAYLKTVIANKANAKTVETARRAYYYDANGNPNTGAAGIFGTATSYTLLSANENLLIKAECEARLNGLSAGVAALNLHRAQLALQFPTGTYAGYVDADFASVNALLQEILTEKYVSLYGQIEIFSEVRRTDNAVGVPPNQGTNFPERFLISQAEINSNTSVPSPVPGLFDPIAIFQ